MSETGIIRSVALAEIRAEAELQPRATLDLVVLAEYADAMAAGVAFPPVVVFHDGETYWLSEGFHRYHAAERAGMIVFLAEVRKGGRRDALLHAAGSNADHGLRRTNDDKRRAVEMLLGDSEWVEWGDREIGRACVVSHTFVAECRAAYLATLPDSPPPQPRLVERNGTTYRMDTGRIGATAPSTSHLWAADRQRVEMARRREQVSEPEPAPIDPASVLDDAALGRIKATNLWLEFTKGVAAASLLMLHDPAEIAGVLDAGRWEDTRHFIARLRSWLDALEGAGGRGLHIVEKGRANR